MIIKFSNDTEETVIIIDDTGATYKKLQMSQTDEQFNGKRHNSYMAHVN